MIFTNDFSSCKIGLYEKALPNDWPLVKKVAAAEKYGYDYFELSVDQSEEKMGRAFWDKGKKREVKRAVCGTVPIYTMCLSANRSFPLGSAEKAKREKGAEIVRGAIDLAFDIGIKVIQIAGYDEYPKPSNEQTRRRYAEALAGLVEFGAGSGVIMAMENVEAPYYSTLEDMRKIVDEINSPYLLLYPDIGNLCAAGAEVKKDLENHTGKTVGFHVKDTKAGIMRDIPYGKGTVDFQWFFEYLLRKNFSGVFTAEMWAAEDSEAAERYIGEALEYIRLMMARAEDAFGSGKECAKRRETSKESL